MASADFCTITARIAAGRALRLVDVAASFFDTRRAARRGAGSWYPGGTNPANVAIQSHRTRCRSPTVKDTNCQCTNAAFTVGVEPVGFAAMCQLASTPSALTMRFLFVVSHICTQASSRPTLAGQPLPSASG